MPGGLMQLASESAQNIILTHNPSKTFFKNSYAKYTNFALQKFTLNFEGTPELQVSENSFFTFKVKRYADLLMDTTIAITLPNIYSPIIPPSEQTGFQWVPYEFKWIKHIGAQMISTITVTCGNQTIQEITGDFILNQVERDFPDDKKKLFYKMIGHTPELYDPANSGTRVNTYPNCFYTDLPIGAEPSIRSTVLYIPLNLWFSTKPSMAFPLVSLQYNELVITVSFRPIQELYIIRDVFDVANNFPYVAPNHNSYYMQMYRFLQTPPDVDLGPGSYLDKRINWNSNIYMLATYCFLSEDEARIFAFNEQSYLIKQVRREIFYNLVGPAKVQVETIGMVSSLMFFFQRSDIALRNEWSNYTNFPYDYLPYDLILADTVGDAIVQRTSQSDKSITNVKIGPGVNRNAKLTGIMITGTYNFENTKDILVSLGILFDGSYRENLQSAGVYQYVEKYNRSTGFSDIGLYCYNFALNTNHGESQPSGASNLNRFLKVELELNTIIPPLDVNAQTLAICDPTSGNIVGINKPTWRIYQFTYNLVVFQERFNMLVFTSGNCGLMYAT
jgi:hypothetical protein